MTGSMPPPSPATTITSKATDSTSIASSTLAGHNETVASIPQQLYPSSTSSSGSHQLLNREAYWDSDFEAERDPPDWRPKMNQDELARLRPKEKKRQDVINGKSSNIYTHDIHRHTRNLLRHNIQK